MNGVIGPTLELATLPQRHPHGDILLNQFGPALIHRLSINPTELPAGSSKREVTVDRIKQGSGGKQFHELREVGWSGIPDFTVDFCTRLRWTVNDNDITEYAAIAMMCLLVHELEAMTVREVLQIGSGPDYVIQKEKGGKKSRVEVSGVSEDATGAESRSRLTKKTNQVLRKNASGYVSVTTFHHPPDGIVHSYLHYVKAEKAPKGAKGKTEGRRRKRK